jgi:5-methylcytosine-specific restriction protein A
MPPRPCLEPGCPRLSPQTRCPEHTRTRQRARDQARSGDPIRVFRRSQAWIKTSRTFRAAMPAVCARCGATDRLTVGHKIPLRQCLGTGLELDWSNLQVECTPCQNQQGHQQ